MKRNNLAEFRGFLGHLQLTEELLFITDASPYLVCFVPAIDRLAELLEKFPTAFHGLSIPSAAELRAWCVEARQEIGRCPKALRELGSHLNKSGLEASIRASGKVQHHLKYFGMLKWGTYASLVVTKSNADCSKAVVTGFDQVSAWILGVAIKHNLQAGRDAYLEKVSTCDNLSCTEDISKEYRKRVVMAALGLLRLQAMIGPERLFRALAAPNLTASELVNILSEFSKFLSNKRGLGNDEHEHISTAKYLTGIVNLLHEKARQKPKQNTDDDSDDDEEAQVRAIQDEEDSPKKEPTLSGLEGLASLLEADNYPTFLPTIPIEFLEPDAEIDTQDFCEPTDAEIEFAVDNDLAIEEVISQSPYTLEELDFPEQEQDEATLTALTVNASDFKRRLAERQPTRVTYVGLDARMALAHYLQEKIQLPDATGSASLLLALALLTGRNLERISSQLVVLDESTDAEILPANRSIALQPATSCIWLRLNCPDVYPENSRDARPTRRWIALPDVLGVTQTLNEKSILDIDGSQLGDALRQTLLEMKSKFGISRAQLQNMLSDTFISQEGHGCTAALICDVSDMSMKVNLHYLSPSAERVGRAYRKAVSEMLGWHGLPDISIQQTEYLGMHMCPSEATVMHAIRDLASFSGVPGQWRKTHNQITLATFMLLAMSIGARDAIGYDPHAFEVINGYGVSHYVEKGEMRVVVLPKILIEQLRAYDQHMAVIRQLWRLETGTDQPFADLFFMFDESGQPSTFHPKSFSKYLEEFGIVYQTPLNGLRRLIFSLLYELDLGPVLDIYIGHAKEGRRPWAQISGARLEPLCEVASRINEFLIEMSWPVVRGCSLVPR